MNDGGDETIRTLQRTARRCESISIAEQCLRQKEKEIEKRKTK